MLNTGDIFAGRYRVDGVLGRGGMGTVYRAFDQLTQEMVGLKLIDPALAEQQLLVEKFKQELAMARRITHPNVVRIFDLGAADAVLFISMELVEGQTLAEELKAHGPMRPEQARPILRQFLEAMREIHAQNILHRDIKPANVMITPSGVVKVMDFGIARDLSTDKTIGMLAFTPGYAAPEVTTGQPASYASDIYSIGAMAYELLVGAKPGYPADAAKLPADLRGVVLDCLSLDAAARPRSVEEVLRRLNTLPAADASATKLFTPGSSTVPVRPPASPIGKGVWIGLGTGGLAVALTLGYLLMRPAPIATRPSKVVEAAVTVPKTLPTTVQAEGEMRLIPGGPFEMGNKQGVRSKHGYYNEAPVHTVDLPDFYLDRAEVSAGRLRDYVHRTGGTWTDKGKLPTGPATGVSWDLALEFCQSIGKRLPTEAEWEKAAAGSNHIPADEPFAVETAKDESRYGIGNLASNVIEWVADEYALYPGNGDLLPETEKGKRVFRGFGHRFHPDGLSPVTIRGALKPGETGLPVGFRCAASPEAALALERKNQ